jgi:Na+-transporting NADH:ubiquinone oxidoreductase subunit NqrA
MAKKKKVKKIYKNGFNLLEAYPIEFAEKVETIKYDGHVEAFDFPFPKNKVEHVIVNLCPTEPWALPNSAVINNDAQGFPDFLNKLDKVRTGHFPESHCYVVISTQDTELIKELNQYQSNADKIPINPTLQNPPLIPPLVKGGRGDFAEGKYLHVHALDPIYPNDAPVMIVKKTLGLDVAYGQNTAEIGVVILELQTVVGIFEHYMQESEISTRLIPISGTGLREDKILKVKPGTPIQKILDGNVRGDIKCRVFVNGPLNGSEVKDLTQKIDWSTRNIVVLEEKDYKIPFNYARVDELLFTTSLMGELRRCIYCNYCDDICPVGLEPALYWHCYIRGEKQKARLYALEKCIECGLCSFICPSKLELLQIIKECKSLK